MFSNMRALYNTSGMIKVIVTTAPVRHLPSTRNLNLHVQRGRRSMFMVCALPASSLLAYFSRRFARTGSARVEGAFEHIRDQRMLQATFHSILLTHLEQGVILASKP